LHMDMHTFAITTRLEFPFPSLYSERIYTCDYNEDTESCRPMSTCAMHSCLYRVIWVHNTRMVMIISNAKHI